MNSHFNEHHHYHFPKVSQVLIMGREIIQRRLSGHIHQNSYHTHTNTVVVLQILLVKRQIP